MATKLLPVQIRSPGRLGLNTQSSSLGLGPEWALFLDNSVFDDLGRIAARKGMLKVTTTPISGNPTLDQTFEYIQNASTEHIITVDKANIPIKVCSFFILSIKLIYAYIANSFKRFFIFW